jgi:hypothetical protein
MTAGMIATKIAEGTTQQEVSGELDLLALEDFSPTSSLRTQEIAPIERLAFTLMTYLEAIGINKTPTEIEHAIEPIIYQTILQTSSPDELDEVSYWVPFLGDSESVESSSFSELLTTAVYQDPNILAQAAPRIAETLCDTEEDALDCTLHVIDLASHWDEFLAGEFTPLNA